MLSELLRSLFLLICLLKYFPRMVNLFSDLFIYLFICFFDATFSLSLVRNSLLQWSYMKLPNISSLCARCFIGQCRFSFFQYTLRARRWKDDVITESNSANNYSETSKFPVFLPRDSCDKTMQIINAINCIWWKVEGISISFFLCVLEFQCDTLRHRMLLSSPAAGPYIDKTLFPYGAWPPSTVPCFVSLKR